MPAGAYSVCDDEPLTRREWADVLADAAGAPRPKLLPPWMALLGGATMELLSRSQRMTNARLKGVSRWSPHRRSARDGVRAAVRTLLDAEPAAAASIGARSKGVAT